MHSNRKVFVTVGTTEVATLLGLKPGQVVQELGWDDDVDEVLRDAIMDAIDADLVDEAVDGVDAVLLWWRADDGDVADALVDSLTDLSKSGHVWLATPKVGRPGHVDAADISEGVTTAGMAVTAPVGVSQTWHVQKVVRPKAGRGR
ncbi:DUF3052 domain-containing protein [Aestuariimicrobium sp. T2.26MG-19.2B]|uniref:DUF3052 domain-containing protein n=1 Tax=Aestuariimicrobium sp. T2.26MG-19.2B TaxID=3040679 RepID=UPI0024774F4B|nr:DUF3052 domain-containing protein [Aestuariimicrobium sp. T2.26MG-19.2B]CAI9411006.1 putative protein [Aestuariimicrobium sp. T2.26MG-19.2B]